MNTRTVIITSTVTPEKSLITDGHLTQEGINLVAPFLVQLFREALAKEESANI